MKYSIILLLFCISAGLSAQNFEGSIAWDIKTEIRDPKMKAQMEQAQKQMNDPATQKKMKEMQAQMNDPQFKAMMESNPQMKAQMEKMMSMASSGNMTDMIPRSMTVKIKNGNSLTRMEGGMLSGEILYLKEKSVTYHIDKENKTYSSLGKATDNGDASKATVTNTGESEKILGYSCQKYKVDMQEKGKPLTQWIWATTEIKGIDMKGFASQGVRGNRPSFYTEIDGVPLKIEMTMPEMDMVMEASAVKKESLSAGDFTIPSGFTEVKGMFGSN